MFGGNIKGIGGRCGNHAHLDLVKPYIKPLKYHLIAVVIQLTTCLKKLTTTYGSMSAVLSPMKALVTLAMMLELLRGRPSARYTFTKKRAQGRSEGKPSGISRFLRKKGHQYKTKYT